MLQCLHQDLEHLVERSWLEIFFKIYLEVSGLSFIVVMVVIFLLGFFLDFIEIAVVVVPIIAPILLAETGANVTAVWLGVMIGVNLQTSFLTPPFGFSRCFKF